MIDLIGKNIDLNSQVKTKTEALKALCKSLQQNGVVSDKDLFFQDVLNREAIGATGMENGIAIPHGESEAAKKATIAVLKTANNLEWESLDGKPIHLIFLLVVPSKNRNINHLKILAKLSAALTHKDIQQKLLKTDDVKEFKSILEKAGGF
ncbi:fructose PTS transporter subunit IIA [Lactobacillus sp. ESL0791]|uniref:PTS sugar transporter subunit IIA n=1 Tax=Lactobacillus sp. ESL0791 TaxID=2983234 RepID=UPI0023F7E361|nr:fructose PTS transporter subunit IIA [Lactobacillus sp. ESL0791]MDF7639268.1 fructose PTS transporter subunit IIA [Lactobacillus sp. ESL0791]